MKLLEDRVALVTGAAQGIGLAIAKTFAEQGASVVIADVSGEAAEEAKDSIEKLGAHALTVEADVRDPEQVQAMVDAASELGSLDVLVNNAGITRDATMRKMTLEDWQAVIDVHLKGTFLATQAASLVMREQKRGAMVNISSISGKIGLAGQTNYSAAKAGIVGFTKAAAKELAHHGVRVNAIQPGLIRTAMTAALRGDIFQQREAEIPLGRAGEPEEVAKVALFLASDLSSYMTGTVLEVTGGRHM